MHEGVMKAWLESSHLGGGNMAYVDELYESYLAEPTSVSDEWREFFAKLPKIDGVDLEVRHADVRQQYVVQMICDENTHCYTWPQFRN